MKREKNKPKPTKTTVLFTTVLVLGASLIAPNISHANPLGVPYIRQCGDTSDDFNGSWACGATSAVMITAYYNRLPADPIWCTFCDPDHYSDYGKYVSEVYTLYGYTFDETSPDASGNPAYGAYGYIHDSDGYAHKEYARGYFRRHGLFSKVIDNPSETDVKTETDKGHPVWASTNLWPSGHIVVIKGYTDDGYYIVNDPWPNGYDWCYMGNDMPYSWSEMETSSKWIVTAEPVRPGDNVKALYSDIHVREAPTLSGNDLGYVGDVGIILGDSTYGCFHNSDGYTWWKIEWDNGLVGWSACGYYGYGENWIEKIAIDQTLSVSLSANPSSGTASLIGVDLTATIFGTATGTINYTFYCNRSDDGTNITYPTSFKIDGRNPDGTGGTVINWGIATDYSGGTTFTVYNVCDYTTAGTYTAKVIAERGSAPPAEERVPITVTPSNHDPELSSGYVDPSSGDINTDFYWYVNYYDQDGDSPSTKKVYIDGTDYIMSLYSGSASNGTYRYGPKKLAGGSHDYYFYFTDGNGGSDRLPSSGTYSGPSVSGTGDSYEPDNTYSQANWIYDGSLQTHSIIPADDVDWVKFLLSEESEVVIETSGSSGDTRMWLYNSGLTQLEYDDDGGTNTFSRIDRICSVDALPAGTYYVKIDEYGNNDEIRSYDITLTVNGCEGDEGWKSPTAHGKVYDDWTNPENAYVEDGVYAIDDATSGLHRQDYYNFNFDIPENSIINGIEIKIKCYVTPYSGTTRKWLVHLYPGGISKFSDDFGSSITTVHLGGSSDTWGETWSPDDFSNDNFRIRLQGDLYNAIYYVDSIQVKVYYTEIEKLEPDLNGDGIVNFFDFAILAKHWLDTCSEPDWCQGSDSDHSGSVDLEDLLNFVDYWLWCRADLDLDGAVNFTDYAVFADNWMDDTCCDPNWCEGSDFNHSGAVDFVDLLDFVSYWLWQVTQFGN